MVAIARMVTLLLLLLLLSSSHAWIGGGGAARCARSSRLTMARPGQSEAQQKQEREDEIRATLARLQRDGKLPSQKGGGDPSESMIKEAEAFFNPKESPLQKFARQNAERKAAKEEQDKALGGEE
jgi:cell division protein FtsB